MPRRARYTLCIGCCGQEDEGPLEDQVGFAMELAAGEERQTPSARSLGIFRVPRWLSRGLAHEPNASVPSSVSQLLLGPIAVVAIGILLPRPGQFMAHLPTRYVAVATIFVCSGLLFSQPDLRAALSAWPAAIWGCLAIPCFAFHLSQLIVDVAVATKWRQASA